MKIIASMKNLPSKNRISEEDFQQIQNDKLDASAEAPEPLEIEGYMKITQIFIDNWIYIENKNPHSYDFTDETYELAHLMESYCLKLYEIFYKLFYLPHPSSVDTHFSKTLKEKKEELIDKSKLEANIQNYRNKCNLQDNQIDICLSIDECSFDRIKPKNMLLFIICSR